METFVRVLEFESPRYAHELLGHMKLIDEIVKR
jgi:hypothetical protein